MRTAIAMAIGVVVGVATAAAIHAALERPAVERFAAEPAPPPVVAPPPTPMVRDAARFTPLSNVAPERPRGAVPITPDYGPPTEAARPIYRCRSRNGTAYSNEPCVGGSVVDEASAVQGYDSRPSDRLARLIENGRGGDQQAALPPQTRSRGEPLRESVECANLRQQVRDIDAATLRPSRPETLDEWRRIRQDIVTSMSRNHC